MKQTILKQNHMKQPKNETVPFAFNNKMMQTKQIPMHMSDVLSRKCDSERDLTMYAPPHI